MIYLFVLDHAFTSKRLTTRTEKLTKCCEPLQYLRVRLWPCKTGLSPPIFCVTDRSKAIRLWWFFFLSLCLFLVLLAPYSSVS